MKTLLFVLTLCFSQLSNATAVIPSIGAGWVTEIRRSCCVVNHNYLVGRYTQNSYGFNDPEEFRNYFVFDLSGLTKTVVSATLRLEAPPTDHIGYTVPTYNSQDPTETFELFSYESDVSLLMDVNSGNPLFNDLGNGTSFGSVSVSTADIGTVVEITLNSAAINSATGFFALSGAITSLSAGIGDEFMFGRTGPSTRELVLQTIPIPASTWLFGSAC